VTHTAHERTEHNIHSHRQNANSEFIIKNYLYKGTKDYEKTEAFNSNIP